MELHHAVKVRSAVPVRWLGVRYPGGKYETGPAMDLTLDKTASRDATLPLPANTPITQPYWLREEGTTGLFRVDDASLIDRPGESTRFSDGTGL